MKNTEFLRKKVCGYLTVYLALTLAVLLPLCMVLIEGVRSNAFYFESECITDIGVNSIFAEYHRELFNQYNIFAIDSSYGTTYAGKANTEEHLKEYMERNMSIEDVFLSDYVYRDFLAIHMSDAEMTRISFLTDDSGAVFRECAVDAVKNDVGLELLELLNGWMAEVEADGLDGRDISDEKQKLDEEIERMVEEAQSDTEEEIVNPDGTVEIIEISYEPYVSPTAAIDSKQKEGILKTVVDDTATLSAKVLDTANLYMARMNSGNISTGNIQLSEKDALQKASDRFFFQEYLLKYMGYYGNVDDSNTLEYQIEYLIAGKASDIDNLRSVAERLCLLRGAANAVYIFSDETKCEEAEILATVIAALVQAPEIEPVLKNSILIGWAYAESLYDVKTLFSGGKIPLMKDKDTWHYSLQGALSAGNDGDNQGEGLSYEDYLRIFMMLTNEDILTKRAMNIVEADIRQTAGNRAFRLDACIVEAEIVTETKSSYGYTCQVTQRKKY